METCLRKKLRIGIIGCGRISVMHFVSVQVLKNAQLVACCDIEASKAKQAAEKYQITPYVDYKDMLEKEHLDAVHICLPHYLHTSVSSYAIERGVHVLCEKPMSIAYKDAERVVKLAGQKGVLYGIIFQCRYNDASQFVKSRVYGKLGKVISVRSVLTWDRKQEYYDSSDWKGTWDKEGGGVVIDQAIHSIDLVRWIVDSEAEKISCSFANRNHAGLKVEDSAEGLITFRNGVKYGFYCMNNYACDEPIEIRFYCEHGKAIMTYDDAYITYNDGTKEEIHQDFSPQMYENAKIYWGFQHVKQIEQFYKACLGEERLEISGAEALKTQKLICGIYKDGKKHFDKHSHRGK